MVFNDEFIENQNELNDAAHDRRERCRKRDVGKDLERNVLCECKEMNLFDPDSKFSQIMGTVFDYLKLGFLAVLTCIPILTAGAGITAAMSVGMGIARQEAPCIWKPFWASFRQNFKQSVPLTLLCVLTYALLAMDFQYVMTQESTLLIRVNRAGIFIAAALGSMIFLYFFPILARYHLTNWQIIRNSVVYAILNFPKNLLAIGILIVGVLMMNFIISLLPVFVLGIPSLMIFYMSNVCAKSFGKMEARQREESSGSERAEAEGEEVIQ